LTSSALRFLNCSGFPNLSLSTSLSRVFDSPLCCAYYCPVEYAILVSTLCTYAFLFPSLPSSQIELGVHEVLVCGTIIPLVIGFRPRFHICCQLIRLLASCQNNRFLLLLRLQGRAFSEISFCSSLSSTLMISFVSIRLVSVSIIYKSFVF